MKQFFIMVILFGWGGLAFSQKVRISGTAVDDTGVGLPGATVMLQKASDSVMVGFAISNKDGFFKLDQVPKDQYLLLISFLGYENHTSIISQIDETSEQINMGIITLRTKLAFLDNVTVNAERIPMEIKNDTIEYNAVAFQTQPNANVEALLKKLPGVEVERDGTIRAQGERVNKILVDGKEFFGDNPQIATKNLPADAVKKVQVFNKKSEFSEFTGIDDGNDQKTINLALKEDRKNGKFGKTSGALGWDNRYLAKANVNQFNADNQLSMILNANNINELGISFNDYLNFMGGLSGLGATGGSFSMNLNMEETGVPISDGPVNGQVNSATGGLNFNKSFSKKTELSANYFTSRVLNNQKQSIDRTNFLTGGQTFQTRFQNIRQTTNMSHRLNLRYKYKISPLSELKIESSLGFMQGDSHISEFNQVENTNNVVQNEANNVNSSDGLEYSAKLRGIYMQKFQKAGRSVFLSATGNLRNDLRDRLINSTTVLYGWETLVTELDQEQNNRNENLDYSVDISFTEPLSKKQYLELGVSHQDFSNYVKTDFYDLNGVRIFNPLLSLAYNRDFIIERFGGTYNFVGKKFKFGMGSSYQLSTLKGEIRATENNTRKHFNSWLPKSYASYEFGTGKTIMLNYQTSLQAPSLMQLQPIVNNSDPLNLYIGNPDLSAEYKHQLNMSLSWFENFSFTNLFANLTYINTQNKIVEEVTFDEDFVRTIIPVNTPSENRINASVLFSRPVKPLGIKFNINNSLMLTEGYVFINGNKETVQRTSNTTSFGIENRKKKIIDAMIGVRYGLNTVSYAQNQLLNDQFFNQGLFADLLVNIKDKWIINQNFEYNNYSSASFSQSQSLAVWTASVSRMFLKDNRGELKLSAFDLLNQNQGIDRRSSANFLEEQRVNALQRYFMFSFIYSLSAFKSADTFEVKQSRF